MLDESRIVELAQRLQKAEGEKQFIRMFSIEHPEMTIEDAYAIQRAWTAIKLANGRVVKGHKIGLTSRAMQSALGIDEPDYGVLFDDMFWNDGAVIPFEKYLSARIEVELAFVLAKPLAGPDCTIFNVLDATSYVTPALEILESRMHRLDPQTQATRKVTDTISHHPRNRAIVTGGRPFRPEGVDLRWVSALLFRNGQIEETGDRKSVV